MNNDIAVREAPKYELSVEEVLSHVQKVHAVMAKAMHEGHHYGVIPGTGRPNEPPKPTLLKSGAELLCVMFRLGPRYRNETIREDDGHLTITCTCELWHIPTNVLQGEGMACCSTREKKFAWRQASRVCPDCGAATIRKSKQESGWYCWRKIGGCGLTFFLNDARIVDQHEGRVANEDLADSYNTVLKMASKRALVAAVLTATAASDIFTQDLEDLAPEPIKEAEPKKEERKEPKTTARTVTKDNIQQFLAAQGAFCEASSLGTKAQFEAYIDSICQQLGFPSDFAKWTQQQVNSIVEETKVYKAKRTAEKERIDAGEVIPGVTEPAEVPA